MKVLVLYTRLTGYWMACMRQSHQEYGFEFFVLRKRSSPDAPFCLEDEAGIRLMDSEDFDEVKLLKLAEEIQPVAIYVAGWGDKRYLQVAKWGLKNAVPVICGMDNQWLGTAKQQLASLLAPVYLKKHFSHIWIPGALQLPFAQRLGFGNDQILKGLYCADLEAFRPAEVTGAVPKRFVFTGRLVEHKGLDVLLEALDRLGDGLKDWEFVVIGNGPYAERVKANSRITHYEFMSPEELCVFMREGGVFVLPSHYEAWGVVVHEAMAVGMPVISTYQCGAADELVVDGYNGFKVNSGDVDVLVEALSKFVVMDSETLQDFSDRSLELSRQVTLESWSASLSRVAKKVREKSEVSV
ncbi:glycosyltransferase [Fulvitalea axinellae]